MIAIIPAAGDAIRMNGLPKYLFPILGQNRSLLDYHIEKLINTKMISRIFIITQPQNIGFFAQWFEKPEITIIVKKTDSMESSIYEVTKMFGENEKFLLIMPDTFFSNIDAHNIITGINSESDLTFILWKTSEFLIGKVGQIKLDSNSKILDLKDKDVNCDYNLMWGSLMFKGKIFDKYPYIKTIPDITSNMITNGIEIKGFMIPGEYIDCGTPQGLRRLLIEYQNF